ncbi:D-alanyl-D-alanine carboxypeptidase family protein [Hazenella coriacea]|uniref:serine-type D-Ala-D-Ala carboxypeptidase n=1 Tax=Hazenella coriacea TaxID=1179467 RepID=A0A4R3L7J8_9BACL|nr:D-alanyl-D-alanine carboxypeptidase family protein [Hazenella coriacea]TCS93466.1 D-alanyl-D-alanine carboxypeptidase (penicillin-binding protein 5/6) [Hazenella coriacea]
MRRKVSIVIIACCFVCTSVFSTSFAQGEQKLAPQANSAILMDADTGTILFEKNSHEPLPPASITKVMTMLLVMEAIDSGKITLQDKVPISEYAASMGGSQIFLEPGEQMTVNDLLKGVAIASANDASVALAELIAGTEENFVQMMNDRAQELGLKNTQFQNPNGLPADNHFSSAYDIAIMSRELLKHEEITKYTGVYQDYLRQNTEKPFWLVNTNKLVRFYEGLDGLKTGFTSEAMFCLTATAKRGNFRVIAVVMGEPNVKTRNAEISGMLNYAFNQFTNILLYKKGDVIAQKEIDKGDPNQMVIRANHPFSIMIKKGENPDSYTKKVVWNDLKAPIQNGQVIGKIQVYKQNQVVAEMDLTSAHPVERAGLWTTIKRVVNQMLLFPKESQATD